MPDSLLFFSPFLTLRQDGRWFDSIPKCQQVAHEGKQLESKKQLRDAMKSVFLPKFTVKIFFLSEKIRFCGKCLCLAGIRAHSTICGIPARNPGSRRVCQTQPWPSTQNSCRRRNGRVYRQDITARPPRGAGCSRPQQHTWGVCLRLNMFSIGS